MRNELGACALPRYCRFRVHITCG